VHWRRRGRWDGEVKEVEGNGTVYEGAKNEGDMQWRGAGGRERTRGLGHVLRFLFVGRSATTTGYGLAKCQKTYVMKERTSSNFAFPEGVVFTG